MWQLSLRRSKKSKKKNTFWSNTQKEVYGKSCGWTENDKIIWIFNDVVHTGSVFYFFIFDDRKWRVLRRCVHMALHIGSKIVSNNVYKTPVSKRNTKKHESTTTTTKFTVFLPYFGRFSMTLHNLWAWYIIGLTFYMFILLLLLLPV